MLKVLSVMAAVLFAAGTLMAQEIALPAPGGPGEPPAPPASQRPVPPPPSNGGGNGGSGTLEPFPNQPNQPVANDPIVYTMGAAQTMSNGSSRDFVFYPDAGYNRLELINVIGTVGYVYVNSVRVTYRDGRQTELQPALVANYHANQGRILMLVAPNVSSVIVNARNAGSYRDPVGQFQVKVKATQTVF